MSQKTSSPKNPKLVEDASTVKGRRQEVSAKRREDRLKKYERNQRQWMITKIAAGVVGVIVAGFLGYAIVHWANHRNDNAIPKGVVSYTYSGGQHDASYNAWPEVPPVGGIHNPVWQQCGYYSAPIDPGKGVHDLEHGAVWITYRPDLPQDQVDILKGLADSQDYITVSPYPGLPSPVVATAWNKQLPLDSATDKRLQQFIKVFRHSATNAPEPGASCSTGDTTTIGPPATPAPS